MLPTLLNLGKIMKTNNTNNKTKFFCNIKKPITIQISYQVVEILRNSGFNLFKKQENTLDSYTIDQALLDEFINFFHKTKFNSDLENSIKVILSSINKAVLKDIFNNSDVSFLEF